MNKVFKFFIFLLGIIGCFHLEAEQQEMENESPFFLSTDPIFFTEKNDPKALKDMNTFIFLFALKMEEEEVESVLDFFHQELSKVGKVTKKEIFTDQGIDIICFSNPRFKFDLNQLVDEKNRALPILQTRLTVEGCGIISSNKTLVSLKTCTWSIYQRSEKQTVLSALKSSVPLLLKEFLADFEKANDPNEKPNFLITYDASWWLGKPKL